MTTVISSGMYLNPSVSSGELDVIDTGSAVGTQLSGSGEIKVYKGGTVSGIVVTASGMLVVSSGGTASGTRISAGGTENVYANGVDVGTVINTNAFEVVYGGTVTSAIVNAFGEQQVVGGIVNATSVGSAGLMDIAAGAASGTVVLSAGTEQIEAQGLASGTMLTDGGRIDLSYFTFRAGNMASLDTNDVLTVHATASSTTVSLAGDYTNQYFSLSDDGTGGTFITEQNTPCLCLGTAVMTDRGEVLVEALSVGDRVVTASGRMEPVRWIGHRRFSGPRLAGRREVLPILIRQGALGAGLPRRDLRVSPEHAMFLDGLLVPARQLVNDTSIVQERQVTSVRYFHVELAQHDLILAEGALTETYLDDNNRGMFENAHEHGGLYPDLRPLPPVYCARRVESGFELEAIRRRLAAPLAA